MKAHLSGIALPLLLAAYPILFLYGHNAQSLEPSDMTVPLGLSLIVAALAYGMFYLLLRKSTSASLAAAVFMVFYFLYGVIFHQLTELDKFPVDHFTVLPVVVIVAGYIGYFLKFLKPKLAAGLQRVLVVICLVLVIYNLSATVITASAQKAAPVQKPIPLTGTSAQPGKQYPDIYYILFDEYARFDVMRNYWHNNDVDQFEAFLEQNNFFIVSNSRSVTINTQTEMASRFNLHQYTDDTPASETLAALNNNKVMQILKSYGYTIVSLNMPFHDITADYNLNYDPGQVAGMASDEFRQLFLDDTMFNAFKGYFQDNDPVEVKERDLILYTLNKATDLGDIKSPKFVYVHVLLPHLPFIFDKDGNLLPIQDIYDWHYYLGQYQYATKLGMQLLTTLLAQADPKNPPVIIFQSDHGARNLQTVARDSIVLNGYLENYPMEYAHDNMNALYLPGYDTSTLSTSMPPIDTMEIVLNHYLNANVSVDSTPSK
jgi:hypothetical protein